MCYSPRIDQHTRTLYRLAHLLGKPMTGVADDLLRCGLDNLERIYGEELAAKWAEIRVPDEGAALAEDPPSRR
jgi:hypothetical protein